MERSDWALKRRVKPTVSKRENGKRLHPGRKGCLRSAPVLVVAEPSCSSASPPAPYSGLRRGRQAARSLPPAACRSGSDRAPRPRLGGAAWSRAGQGLGLGWRWVWSCPTPAALSFPAAGKGGRRRAAGSRWAPPAFRRCLLGSALPAPNPTDRGGKVCRQQGGISVLAETGRTRFAAAFEKQPLFPANVVKQFQKMIILR